MAQIQSTSNGHTRKGYDGRQLLSQVDVKQENEESLSSDASTVQI